MLKTVNAALKAKAIKFGLEVLQAKAWPRGAQGQGLASRCSRPRTASRCSSRCSRPRPGLEVLKAKAWPRGAQGQGLASRCSRPRPRGAPGLASRTTSLLHIYVNLTITQVSPYELIRYVRRHGRFVCFRQVLDFNCFCRGCT